MATPFIDIYKKFLMLIDDYELGLVSEEEMTLILFGYLDQARSLHFPQCKKNLESITEEGGGLGHFNDELSSQEQYILALGMKKAWLSPKLNSVDLMKKAIGDRDYKAVQGTNYLRELSNLNEKIEEEIRNYTISYTYNNFNLEGW